MANPQQPKITITFNHDGVDWTILRDGRGEYWFWCEGGEKFGGNSDWNDFETCIDCIMYGFHL